MTKFREAIREKEEIEERERYLVEMARKIAEE